MAKKKSKTPEPPVVRRRCRGPYNGNVGEVLKRLERSKHVLREHIGLAVEVAVRDLGDDVTTGQVVGALVASDPEAARALNRAAYGGCGADLNPAIAELPVDGQSHDFACPACDAPHHATRVPAD